jgi:hypothetical protein
MYFVMLYLNNGMPTPMIDADGDPAIFQTRKDAETAAENNPIGQALGYKVYEW